MGEKERERNPRIQDPLNIRTSIAQPYGLKSTFRPTFPGPRTRSSKVLWFADCNSHTSKEKTMFRRSHVVSFVAAIVLAGSALAQPQPPPGGAGQTSPDVGTRPPNPGQMGTPGANPGAVPDLQTDPYA